MTLFDPDKLGPELSAYLDGELDARRRDEIERLLRDSSEARKYLAGLREIGTALRGLPRIPAPVELERVVHDGIRLAPRELPVVDWSGKAAPSANASQPPSSMLLRLARSPLFGMAAMLLAGMVAGRYLLPVGSGVARRIPSDDALPSGRALTEREGRHAPPAGDAPDERAARGTGAGVFVGRGSESSAAGDAETRAARLKRFGSPTIDEPVCTVVVAANTDADYYAARGAARAFQNDASESDDGETITGTAPSEEMLSIELPASMIPTFVNSLESHAPSQVQVSLEFQPTQILRVQQLVSATAFPLQSLAERAGAAPTVAANVGDNETTRSMTEAASPAPAPPGAPAVAGFSGADSAKAPAESREGVKSKRGESERKAAARSPARSSPTTVRKSGAGDVKSRAEGAATSRDVLATIREAEVRDRRKPRAPANAAISQPAAARVADADSADDAGAGAAMEAKSAGWSDTVLGQSLRRVHETTIEIGRDMREALILGLEVIAQAQADAEVARRLGYPTTDERPRARVNVLLIPPDRSDSQGPRR